MSWGNAIIINALDWIIFVAEVFKLIKLHFLFPMIFCTNQNLGCKKFRLASCLTCERFSLAKRFTHNKYKSNSNHSDRRGSKCSYEKSISQRKGAENHHIDRQGKRPFDQTKKRIVICARSVEIFIFSNFAFASISIVNGSVMNMHLAAKEAREKTNINNKSPWR